MVADVNTADLSESRTAHQNLRQIPRLLEVSTYKGLKALHADSNESASADEPSDKTARETFIAGQHEFDDLLERLRDACGVHFNVDPERVDWADVGTLYMRLASLRTLCDHVFKEGEQAEPAAGHDGHAFNQDGRKVAVRVPTD